MTNGKLFGLALLGSASLIATAVIAEPVANGGRKLETTMTGANEIPGPGDPDGSGTAKVVVNYGQKRICYELVVSGIATATAAHIHFAPVGVAGAVVVPLSAPSDGDSAGCVDVSAELAKNILKNPTAYYVNVHNADFPAGAIRGQLAKQNH
jgi:hypothetical protein